MILSSKGEYALVALVELALHDGNGPLQARTISQNQKIPLRFLEQVLNGLRRAGFVDSIRGAQGGYILSHPPEELLLGDILEAVEGPIISTGCTSSGLEDCWHEVEQGYCLARDMRDSVRSSVMAALNGISLQTLCDSKQKKEQGRILMYHI